MPQEQRVSIVIMLLFKNKDNIQCCNGSIAIPLYKRVMKRKLDIYNVFSSMALCLEDQLQNEFVS